MKSSQNKVAQFPSLPHTIESEKMILSACLMGCLDQVAGILLPLEFYHGAHEALFRRLCEMRSRGITIELPAVFEYLREQNALEEVGGASYLSKLINDIPAAPNIEHYANLIKQTAFRRSVIIRCNDLSNLAMESTDLGEIITGALKLSSLDNPSAENHLCSYAQLADTQIDYWEKVCAGRTGVLSGYRKLDDLVGGFQPATLNVIAARPAMGKSALMINIAEFVAANRSPINGGPVLVFSLEMSRGQLYSRQTARVARVDTQRFLTGGIQPEEWTRIIEAQSYLHKLPIYIDDSANLKAWQIEQRARTAAGRMGVKLILIDHLQKIKGNAAHYQRKDLEIGEITNSLKDLSKDLDIPVILLCQLNREVEKRDDKHPRLSDLRESGAIEQDADVVAFLYRDEYYNPETDKKGIAEVSVAKNRNGKTGTASLTWIGWRQSFESLQGE